MSKFIPTTLGNRRPKVSAAARKARKKYRQDAMQLPDGLKENPIFRFPKKAHCFCGSGVIFKKCCKPKQPKYITDKEADELEKALKEVGL